MLLIVGRRGKGKTLLATRIALDRMRAGEAVYANYPIVDEANGLRAGRVGSLLDCLALPRCTVVVDEAGAWANSRDWGAVPSEVLAGWQQSRKSGVNFIFTTTHEERVDKVIRELVDFILVCERPGIIPSWVPLFCYYTTYLEQVGEVRRGIISRSTYWWAATEVMAAYNTNERISTEQTQALREYTAAVKRGEKPDPLAFSTGVEPPAYWDGAEWVPLPGHVPPAPEGPGGATGDGLPASPLPADALST